MEEIVYTTNISNTDLIIYECGIYTQCSGQSFGPAVRDFYLLHFVTGGRGIFQQENRSFRLKEGDGFLVSPNRITHYRADSSEPWSYCWLGFSGPKAEDILMQAGISSNSPVFSYGNTGFVKSCFDGLMGSRSLNRGREACFQGYFFLLLSRLIERSSPDVPIRGIPDRKAYYVNRLVRFLELNYQNDITLQHISQYIGLDSKYICAIFKEVLGTSPYRCLIGIRMEKACTLLKNRTMLISEVARSVGYKDPLLFSRMFKKIKGLSPREYRNRL